MGSCKLAAVVATLIAASGVAVGAATVTPSGEVGSLLAPLGDPAWADAPLPAQTLPATRFESIVVDGLPGWRLVVQGSYGNRVHEVRGEAATARRLSWRWGLDRGIDGADLASKPADDAAVKVCVLFDMPDDRVPFVERQMLRVARAVSGQSLPAATLCYAWAPLAREGVVIANAYTRRMRWKVLRGTAPTGPEGWHEESRDLHADFLEAFGDETAQVPPILAVLVGADADNTGGEGQARIVGLALRP